MEERKNVPAIRFAGFDDDWAQRKFSELYEPVAQKNDLTYGIDKNITVATMQYKTGIRVTEKEYLRTYNVFLLGDIAFEGHQSKEFRFGRFVENDIGDGIISHIFSVFRPKMKYNLLFWKYAINNERLMQPILSRCTKASTMMNDLVSTDFLEEFFLVPSVDEQRMIGTTISQIDHLITLHQRKYEKLAAVKKSMLEKLFPKEGSRYPEIRFAGFAAPWELRKLGDVFEEYSEKGHTELPPLTIIQGEGTIRRDESDRNLQYDAASLSSYKLVEEGDFIVHLRSFEGGLEKASTTGIISPAYHTFHGEGTDSRFYYLYFRSPRFIEKDLKPHVYGIRDGRSIDIEGMKTIDIPWTELGEQRVIGSYIEQLDTIIALHQRKLEKLKSIKKALLEKMFV